MSTTPDPERCYFGKECPLSTLDDDFELRSIFDFTQVCITSWEKDNNGRKSTEYGLTHEGWGFACRIFQVPPDKEREALGWVSIVLQAAKDAVKLRGKDESFLSRDLDDEDG